MSCNIWPNIGRWRLPVMSFATCSAWHIVPTLNAWWTALICSMRLTRSHFYFALSASANLRPTWTFKISFPDGSWISMQQSRILAILCSVAKNKCWASLSLTLKSTRSLIKAKISTRKWNSLKSGRCVKKPSYPLEIACALSSCLDYSIQNARQFSACSSKLKTRNKSNKAGDER